MKTGMTPEQRSVLILGGSDVGSAVAHRIFGMGMRTLIVERPQSPHARRGMAYIDALFDGHASLEGVECRFCVEWAQVHQLWAHHEAIPLVTISEERLLSAQRFHVLVDATMRRIGEPRDWRGRAQHAIGLGPGFAPGVNCDVAIETQWGERMGEVLWNQPATARSGGPKLLAGVGRERFVVSPQAGVWRSDRKLGEAIGSQEVIGFLNEQPLLAPLAGFVRGLARNGVSVLQNQRLAEIDPRTEPQVFGLGERPQKIADGVAAVINFLAQPKPVPAS